MRFGVLGCPAIWRDGDEIRLTTRRSRAVLAYLLLTPDHSASADEIVDAIYGDTPPRSARNQVHRGVGELRKSGVTIDVHDNVYRLAVSEDAIDAVMFTRLCEQARVLADKEDHEGVTRTLGTALELWRGPAFSGLDGEVFLAEAAVWNERRISAIEMRIDADLALGRHRDVIVELQQLTNQYPLRERFCGQLMLALYRSQRGSEALQVFTDLRDRLREELGTDPGPEIQELRLRVLRQDTMLRLSPPVAVPKHLPPPPGVLFGRDAELARIVAALEEPERSRPPVVVITGPGGTGKTALGVEAAHRVAAAYPDGQLFAEGGDVDTILAGFLTALGVPETELPGKTEAACALLGDLLAFRRVLIMLDDVPDPGRIRPLLPSHAGCAVIVTCRSPRVPLPGALRVEISALSPGDARALLAAEAGERRIDGEPEAGDRIIELCGGLPAALRTAATTLALRRHWPVARLADRLADPAMILDELAIRPTLTRDYEFLSGGQRSMIRKIGFLGLPVVSVMTAAALEDVPVDVAENLLEEIAEVRLLGTPDGREFHCHRYLLRFGAERAAAEDHPDELSAAAERALGAWLVPADSIRSHTRGGCHCPPSGTAPRYRPRGMINGMPVSPTWFEAHLDAITSLVRRAAAIGLHESCWELAVAPLVLFQSGGYFEVWSRSHEIALACARDAGNLRGQAVLHYSLGYRSLLLGDHPGAGDLLARAREFFVRLGEDHGHGLTLCLLGHLARLRQDLATARQTYTEAITLLRDSGDPVAEADALSGLAVLLRWAGEEDGARRAFDRALALCREGGSLRGEAQIRHRAAIHTAKTGTPEAAYPELLRALEIARHIGDRVTQAGILLDLGITRILLGDAETACRYLRDAEETAALSGTPRTAARARMARAFLEKSPALS